MQGFEGEEDLGEVEADVVLVPEATAAGREVLKELAACRVVSPASPWVKGFVRTTLVVHDEVEVFLGLEAELETDEEGRVGGLRMLKDLALGEDVRRRLRLCYPRLGEDLGRLSGMLSEWRSERTFIAYTRSVSRLRTR